MTSKETSRDFKAYEKAVTQRLTACEKLAPDVREGIERVGRFVHELRREREWSLEQLAQQAGLQWVWLALLEQGLVLPEELTPATLRKLGRTFPPRHGDMNAAALFCSTVESFLPALDVFGFASAATSVEQSPIDETIGARLFRWLSPAWYPPFAGIPATATADHDAEKQTFHLDEGTIQVTCQWWASTPQQPASLWLSWSADILNPGEFRVRFVRRDDPISVFTERSLGTTLTGEMAWSARDLGFDPTRERWGIILAFADTYQ